MNIKSMLVAASAAVALSGCISYTGAVTPGDDQVDEGNKPFASKAAADFKARQQFRRPVVIQEAEGIGLFLSPNYVPRSTNARANALCSNIEVRRTIVQSAKATLREVVGGLKDLQLTGENAPAMVSVSADDNAAPQVYRITYNIANVDLQFREVPNYLDKSKKSYEWVGNVSAEVRMLAPNGNAVFTFNAQGTTSQSDDGSMQPNATMLEQAAADAITTAMKQYALKFGPPIYVTDTCQSGEFARISVGSDYGVREGMKVEFFRHRSKQGLDGNADVAEQRVGTGTIGQGGAPVEPTSAWAHVDGYDKDAPRSVFQWTSVKLLKEEGSTFGLAIPGMK